MKHCHRCARELKEAKDQCIINFDGQHKEYRILCPHCYGLALAFVTPAYIPGISNTEYELLLHKKKNEENVFEQFKKQIRSMREKGFTIPEISKEAGVSNRMIMEVLK